MRSNRRYILVNKKPVPVPDLLEWAAKFETMDRKVAYDEIDNMEPWLSRDREMSKERRKRHYRIFGRLDKRSSLYDDENKIVISTVFLGLDHCYDDGSPILFETMIFKGPCHEYQERYCTWEEAEAGHKVAIELVRKALAEEKTGNGH